MGNFRRHMPEVNVAQEKHDEGGGEQQNDGRPNVRSHEDERFYYNAQSVAGAGAPLHLVVVLFGRSL